MLSFLNIGLILEISKLPIPVINHELTKWPRGSLIILLHFFITNGTSSYPDKYLFLKDFIILSIDWKLNFLSTKISWGKQAINHFGDDGAIGENWFLYHCKRKSY